MGDDPRWDEARAALKEKRWLDAVAALQAICDDDEDDAEAACFLGACFGQIHDFVAAEFYLSRACEVAPQMPQAHFNLGRCFEQRHRLEEAIRSYENALRAQRDYAPARARLQALHAVTSPDVRTAEEEAALAAEHKADAVHVREGPTEA
ncbi:MAG: tetratricopeptide repeat protein [Fimbriimonadaceae bacterium]|nr:tetratricopeptide repeat protein [Fimbriimonadaceae bacterium]